MEGSAADSCSPLQSSSQLSAPPPLERHQGAAKTPLRLLDLGNELLEEVLLQLGEEAAQGHPP